MGATEANLLPPMSHNAHPPSDHRTIVIRILWVLLSGARWRDLPERELYRLTNRRHCHTAGALFRNYGL